jgi:dTDP-glucose pyrophosphorylase
MNLLVLAAASGKHGTLAGSADAFPKNLQEVRGEPLLAVVLDNLHVLRALATTHVCLQVDEMRRFHTGEVIRLVDPAIRVVPVPSETSGAACTALLACDGIDPTEELIVCNGDQLLHGDLSEHLASLRAFDAGTLTFQSRHPRWSFVRLGPDGLVAEAAEKRPISSHATAGFYYFSRAEHFLDATADMIFKEESVEGRFFVAPAFNQLILRGLRVGAIPLMQGEYESLATAPDVERHLASQSDTQHG